MVSMIKNGNHNEVPYKGYIPHEEIEQVVITDYSSPDNIKSIYSPTIFPTLKITTNKVMREIEVVMVSVESEDKQILHRLLTETRSIK